MINRIIAFKKAVASIGFKKAIADIKIGDFLIFRFFFDSLGLSDSESKAFSKPLSDSQAMTDSLSNTVGKSVADTSASSDATTLEVNKSLSNASSISDDSNFAVGKGLSDSGALTENQRMDFHKFVDETFSATDDLDGEATAQDDQEITFVKVRSDLAAMTDILNIVQGKLLGNTSALTDSGSYRGQGYCAFDYFTSESDYVGYSGTF